MAVPRMMSSSRSSHTPAAIITHTIACEHMCVTDCRMTVNHNICTSPHGRASYDVQQPLLSHTSSHHHTYQQPLVILLHIMYVLQHCQMTVT
jgi:hypothetical protein